MPRALRRRSPRQAPIGCDTAVRGRSRHGADSWDDSAALDYFSNDEAESGFWFLNPSEIGPYGPIGAPSATASANFSAITLAFDPTVDTATGDLWSNDEGLTSGFDPLYLDPGQKATTPLTITPTASHGTHVHGVINLDHAFQLNDVWERSSGAATSSRPSRSATR